MANTYNTCAEHSRSTYKDSGIAWIGEIPSEWEVLPIKHALSWKSEKGHGNAQVLSLYRDLGVIPKDSRDDNHNVTSEKTDEYKYVNVGDFVVNKMKAWQGSMALSNYEGIVSPAYYVFSFINNEVHKPYFHHLLRNDSYLPEYRRLSTGLRVGQWDLGFEDFKEIPFLLPSLQEQQSIATFLDSKCSEIDSLISLQEEMISELQAYKQSVITEAVTKGLDPNAKMTESGVEWIGEIPEGWNMRKLKNLCVFLNGDRSQNYPQPDEYKSDGIPFLGADSLVEHYVDCSFARFISEEKYNSMGGLKIQRGDILYTLRGSTIGKNALCNFDRGTVASSLMGIRANSLELSYEYLAYWLNSEMELIQRDSLINGATAPNLSAINVGGFTIYLPPLSEQQSIASYLDTKTSQIDSLISLKQEKIQELRDFKKSIIYEYVTGKKRV